MSVHRTSNHSQQFSHCITVVLSYLFYLLSLSNMYMFICRWCSNKQMSVTANPETILTDWHTHTHTHTHTHPFNGSLSGTTRVSRYQKGKAFWILLKQETVSGSGIRWTVCKSALRSRQITMPAPHHSVFTGRMPNLPPNQQCQSTEGNF